MHINIVKITKSIFLHLRSFYAHKSRKKHKTQNDSFWRFYAHKNVVFFVCCAFLFFYAFLPLRRVLSAFKTTFVFICSCAFCVYALRLPFLFAYVLFMFLCQISNFFPLRHFYACLRLFLFLFAYVLFMLVGSFL